MSTLSAFLLLTVVTPCAIWFYRARVGHKKTEVVSEPLALESVPTGLIGHQAVVASDVLTSREGRVSISLSNKGGRTYEARLTEGEMPLTHGAPVLVIERLDDFTLNVVADELPSLEDHRE